MLHLITRFLIDVTAIIVAGLVTYQATNSFLWAVCIQFLTAWYGAWCFRDGFGSFRRRAREGLMKALARMEADIDEELEELEKQQADLKKGGE